MAALLPTRSGLLNLLIVVVELGRKIGRPRIPCSSCLPVKVNPGIWNVLGYSKF